jgi:AraC-like DNA-binding protein
VNSDPDVDAPPTGRRVRGVPVNVVRRLLARDYLGFTETAGTPVHWFQPPSQRVSLIINVGEHGAIGDPGTPDAFVAGLTDRGAVTTWSGTASCLDLPVHPLGGYRLLGMPMSELTGRVVGFADLFGVEGSVLVDRVREIANWRTRFALLDTFLATRADRGPTPAPEVVWAWRRLTASGGRMLIRDLVDEVGWSSRHLIDRFRQQVGVPPKTYARIVRFNALLRRMDTAPDRGLAALAADAGYTDHAHLVRDFHEFTGTTPTAFIAGKQVNFRQDAGRAGQ